jgi:predicted nucleotidyltransferase
MTQGMQQDIRKISLAVTPSLKDAGVVRCYLFGSYATGTATPTSDVDLLVDFYPGQEPDLFSFIGLKSELEDRLGKRVDMTTSDALSPYIRASVLQNKQTIYEGE